MAYYSRVQSRTVLRWSVVLHNFCTINCAERDEEARKNGTKKRERTGGAQTKKTVAAQRRCYSFGFILTR